MGRMERLGMAADGWGDGYRRGQEDIFITINCVDGGERVNDKLHDIDDEGGMRRAATKTNRKRRSRAATAMGTTS